MSDGANIEETEPFAMATTDTAVEAIILVMDADGNVVDEIVGTRMQF